MTDKNPSNFGDMMIKYFCANCERLKLAEARFRAAEELLDKLLVSNGAHIRRLIHGQMEYKTWLTLKKEAGE